MYVMILLLSYDDFVVMVHLDGIVFASGELFLVEGAFSNDYSDFGLLEGFLAELHSLTV